MGYGLVGGQVTHGSEGMGVHLLITYGGLTLMAVAQLVIGIMLIAGVGESVPFFADILASGGSSEGFLARGMDAAFGILLIVLAAYALLCQRALRLRKEFGPGQLYSYLFFCVIWIFAFALVRAFVLPDTVSALQLVDGVVPFIVVVVLCLPYYRTRSAYFDQPATGAWPDRLGAVWVTFTRKPNAEGQAERARKLKAVMAAGFILFIALLLILLLSLAIPD